MATARELLAETDQAILACLKSQSYSAADRSLNRAQLSQLRELRTDLLHEINEEANGGMMASLGQIDRPI